MLSVTGLRKEFPTAVGPLVVFHDVTFSLEHGQSAAILGPSGSGKSTLLNILGAMDTPTAGTVRLGETDPFALTEKEAARFRNRRVGFVFQEHHLLPQCTVTENVLLPTLAETLPAAEQKTLTERAATLVERVGLTDRANFLPSELSGGQRQRVAIARAMIFSPELILADEPTGNLDAEHAETIVDLLLEMQAAVDAILITVTHSEKVAARMQQQMTMLNAKCEMRNA